ncbi:MAG TPA: hypothetical protein VN372_14915 [Methanospirillum sp.]|nr:hypothetical protein [Methanospirillum sp.]
MPILSLPPGIRNGSGSDATPLPYLLIVSGCRRMNLSFRHLIDLPRYRSHKARMEDRMYGWMICMGRF